jgi:hypothetical protein
MPQTTLDNAGPAPRWQMTNALALVCALAGVVLVRALIVSMYATELPFWDQWDADLWKLYKPLAENRLDFSHLFAPHNEHRVFFTRMLGLLLFSANEGQFDNLVIALVNTVIYAAMIGAFVAPYFRELGRGSLISAALALIVLGALPYGWENITIGFQNQFYFAGLCMVAAVGTLAFAGTRRWLAIAAAAAAALCGLFTMATGTLIAPALIVVAWCLYRNGELSGRQFLVVATVATAIFAMGYALTPSPAAHAAMRPDSVYEFIFVTSLALCWPLPASWIAFTLLWWPCALWTWRLLRRAPLSMPRLDVFLFGVCAWIVLMAVAIAVSRGHGTNQITSRYTETLVLGVVANLLLAIRIVQSLPRHRRKLAAVSSAAIVVAIAALFVNLSSQAMKGAAHLAARAKEQRIAEANINAFLNGAGPSALVGKVSQEVSYPSTPRLISFLSDPLVREMLPASIGAPVAISWTDCPTLTSPGAFTTTPPLAVPAFGTWSPQTGDANLAHCVSNPVRATRSHVRIATAGYLGRPRLGLTLKSEDGIVSVPVRTATQDHERWRAKSIATPGATYVIVIDDESPESWFAISAPSDQGRLSALASSITQSLLLRLEP